MRRMSKSATRLSPIYITPKAEQAPPSGRSMERELHQGHQQLAQPAADFSVAKPWSFMRPWRSALVRQAPIVSGVPISAISISPQNDGVRIVGLDNGQILATTSGSSTLANITGTIPAKYIARAVIDPNNTNMAYVTLSGYFGNSTSHIYKTANLNNAIPTWTGLDGGQIPDVPVNAFVIDPQNSNTLYAGTDIGVYRSVDGGATWLAFSNGLPRVAVFDAAIQNPNRVLRIATHGRGIWEVSVAATPTPTPTPTATATPTPTAT